MSLPHNAPGMDLRNFDLNLLKVLDALLRDRSVSLAARRLNLSQPTVSAALRRLRDAFGEELFVKSARGVEPTPLALALQASVAQVLAHVQENILHRTTFEPATTTRQFVVIAGEFGQMVIVHQMLPRMQAEAPGARIKFIYPDAAERLAALQEGRADLAVGYFPQFASANLYQQLLYARPMVCVARRDHPALSAGPTAEQFGAMAHLVVASLSNVNDLVESQLRKMDLVRTVPVELAHASGAPVILQHSDLIAVVPSVLARIYCENGLLQSYPVPIELPLLEVKQFWHRTVHADPAVTWLRTLVRETYQQPSGTDVRALA